MQRQRLIIDPGSDLGRSLRDHDEVVADRYWAAYIIMHLLGIAALTPWNAMITPIEYLHLRVAGSAFEQSFESVLTTTFTWIAFATLLCMQKFQNYFSVRVRIIGPLILLICIFSILAGLALMPLATPNPELLGSLKDEASGQFFALIACGMLCGVGQAILTGSSMAYASLYASGSYLQAVSVGNGIAGLAVTVSSLVITLPGVANACSTASSLTTRVASDDITAAHTRDIITASDDMTAAHARDIIAAAATYFSVSVAVLVTCLGAFLVVERLPFTRACKRLNARTAAAGAANTIDRNNSSWSGALVEGASSSQVVVAPDGDSYASPPPGATGINTHPDVGLGTSPGDDGSCNDQRGNGEPTAVLWKHAASVCIVYAVTIAIFPSLTSTIIAAPYQNQTSSLAHDANTRTPSSWCVWSHLFVPIGFVLFNLGDMIGRAAPCIMRSSRGIVCAALARIAFAPLFMMCYTAQGSAMQLPVFWGTDTMPLCVMTIFAVSNGWLTSSIFVAVAEQINDATQRESATTLIVTMLNCGICIGASLSFLVRYLDCTPSATNSFDCNPFISRHTNSSA